jgi:hypothetical protein
MASAGFRGNGLAVAWLWLLAAAWPAAAGEKAAGPPQEKPPLSIRAVGADAIAQPRTIPMPMAAATTPPKTTRTVSFGFMGPPIAILSGRRRPVKRNPHRPLPHL